MCRGVVFCGTILASVCSSRDWLALSFPTVSSTHRDTLGNLLLTEFPPFKLLGVYIEPTLSCS